MRPPLNLAPPMVSTEEVKAVLDKETQDFRLASRHWYVDGMSELGLSPKVEEAVILVGSSAAKAYVQVGSSSLQNHSAVLISGKGGNIGKAVAVSEQIKQQAEGRVVQFNRTCLHSSLINPAYKPSSSFKNIQVFLNAGGEEVLSQKSLDPQLSAQTASDVLREIRGHKVYKVPSIAVLLVTGDNQVAEGKLLSWTKQVKQ